MLNKFLYCLFFLIGLFNINTSVAIERALPITGVTSYRMYSYAQADKGAEYFYGGIDNLLIKFFFAQTEIQFRYSNKRLLKEFGAGYLKYLPHEFHVGYDKEGFSKETNRYLVSRADMDGDSVDEIIVAVFDRDCDMFEGVSINVYKINQGSVALIGAFTADNVLGTPIIRVLKNKITVLRNVHGFYYQWTLSKGRFVDTSDL